MGRIINIKEAAPDRAWVNQFLSVLTQGRAEGCRLSIFDFYIWMAFALMLMLMA